MNRIILDNDKDMSEDDEQSYDDDDKINYSDTATKIKDVNYMIFLLLYTFLYILV